MPGGLMQLVFYGAEDIYLTGNPQITFFKTVYRRYTNFAAEYISVPFDTITSFSPTGITKARIKIPRNADLMHDTYIVFDLPDIYSTSTENFRWVNYPAEALVNNVEITIGGSRIARDYSTWFNISNRTKLQAGKKRSYNKLVGHIPDLCSPTRYKGEYGNGNEPTIRGRRLYLPLGFWFCQNPGLALPLVSLQYTDVEIYVEFAPLNNLFTLGEIPVSINTIFSDENPYPEIQSELIASGVTGPESAIWHFINGGIQPGGIWNQNSHLDINYIFLDEPERRRFAKLEQQYLITQVQTRLFDGIVSSNNSLDLSGITGPVREMWWVTRRDDVYKRNEWNNYTNCNYNFSFDPDDPYPMQFREFQLKSLLDETNCPDDSSANIRISPIEFNTDSNIIYTSRLLLSGHERMEFKDPSFFNYLQPYKYYSNCPPDGVYVWSFSINPEQIQPAGSINFNRFNKATMEVYAKTPPIDTANSTEFERVYQYKYDITMFFVSYNILRMIGGIGSTVFINSL